MSEIADENCTALAAVRYMNNRYDLAGVRTLMIPVGTASAVAYRGAISNIVAAE